MRWPEKRENDTDTVVLELKRSYAFTDNELRYYYDHLVMFIEDMFQRFPEIPLENWMLMLTRHEVPHNFQIINMYDTYDGTENMWTTITTMEPDFSKDRIDLADKDGNIIKKNHTLTEPKDAAVHEQWTKDGITMNVYDPTLNRTNMFDDGESTTQVTFGIKPDVNEDEYDEEEDDNT